MHESDRRTREATTPQQRVAARMRSRREQLGLSQNEAGRRIGVTLRTYARWERGETFGYLTQLADVARALELSEADLMGGEDPVAARPSIEDLALKLDQVMNRLDEIQSEILPLVQQQEH